MLLIVPCEGLGKAESVNAGAKVKNLSGIDTRSQEALKNYVFKESDVLVKKAFTMWAHHHRFGYGLIAPKWQERNGQEYQINQPVILVSDGDQILFQEIYNEEHIRFNLKFDTVPKQLPRRYNLPILSRAQTDRTAPDGRGIYEKVKSRYEKYVVMGAQWYSVHPVWDLATYFFQLFDAFPYMELVGAKETGKTRLMQVSRQHSFMPTRILTSITPANLFRIVHDQRGTLYLDECESLFRIVKGRVEHDDRVEILNAGYTREAGVVPRQDKDGRGKFTTVYFNVYCPKMLGSINGLHGATETRAIKHVTTRAPPNDKRADREPEETEALKDLRDDILIWALHNWENVQKAYTELSVKGLPVKRRQAQLWKPLIAVAKLLGEDVVKTLLTVAQTQDRLRKLTEFDEQSWEHRLCAEFWQRLNSGASLVLVKEVRVALGEDGPHEKTVARTLNNLGLRDFYDRHAHGYGWRVDSDTFRKMIEPIIPNVFGSFGSTGSESAESEGFTFQEMNVDERNNNSGEENSKEPPSFDERNEQTVPNEPNPTGKVEANKPYRIEWLAEKTGVGVEKIEARLRHAATRGDWIESKPGVWMMLK